MVFKRSGGPSEGARATQTPWIFEDDFDAHFSRAKAGGSSIVEGIWQHRARAHGALDLEGTRWTFAQASALMRCRAGGTEPCIAMPPES